MHGQGSTSVESPSRTGMLPGQAFVDTPAVTRNPAIRVGLLEPTSTMLSVAPRAPGYVRLSRNLTILSDLEYDLRCDFVELGDMP